MDILNCMFNSLVWRCCKICMFLQLNHTFTYVHALELFTTTVRKYLCQVTDLNTRPSWIFYQIDSLTKTMHCKGKHLIKLKLVSTLLDAGDLILLSDFPKTMDISVWTRRQAISIRILYMKSNWNNRILWMFFFSQTILPHSNNVIILNNAAATNGLFSTNFLFIKILFNCLKAYHQIPPDWETMHTDVTHCTYNMLWFTRSGCQNSW